MPPDRRTGKALLLIAMLSTSSEVAFGADPVVAWSGEPVAVTAAPYRPVALPAARLAALLGRPIEGVGLYAVRAGVLEPIPFQIDARDADGRYLLGGGDAVERVGPDDEWVFMAEDAGPRLAARPAFAFAAAQAIAVTRGTRTAWVYVLAPETTPAARSARRYVRYDAAADAIESDQYRMGFSRAQPFRADRFQWMTADGSARTDNLIDGMKVRHTGSLFGAFAFVRDETDYRSEFVAVKAGPVRVLRRTRNHVRMFLGLRTPALYIDYFAHRHHLVMDMTIDLPFDIGLFLRDVETRTTVDWRYLPEKPPMVVITRAQPRGLVIDGRMSPAKRAFADGADTDFVMRSRYGDILVTLDHDRELPIVARRFLHDDVSAPDPPEAERGQYGNAGFATGGWQDVAAGVYHMRFCLTLVAHDEKAHAVNLLDPQAPPLRTAVP